MILIPNKKLIELSEIERRIYSIFFFSPPHLLALDHCASEKQTNKTKHLKNNTAGLSIASSCTYPDSFCVPEDGLVLEVTLTAFGDVGFTFFSEILY